MDTSIWNGVILFVAAMLASALNAVAGGGSFISFPALVFTGIPDVQASATNTTGLFPGYLAGAGAYRQELATDRRTLVMFSVVGIIGGVTGALLLKITSNDTFRVLLPWLLLLATLLFTFGGRINVWLRSRTGSHPQAVDDTPSVGVLVFQLLVAIYGGFFGGGLGMMTLAALALTGLTDMKRMNALKNVMSLVINGVAVVVFVFNGLIAWTPALLMAAGTVIGGYGAGAIARRMDQQKVRTFVIITGCLMTLYFFARAYVLT